MIPLTLTLKGIYSYIEEQTIEFKDLTDSGLFGIFGAVGSGKSTVLEAITFALYGEIERLNSRDSRAYNMMNLKSQQLLIDFEFFTDSEDTKYRFIVKGKRNKKIFTEVKAFERSSLVSKGGGEWLPSEKTAEDIIGLNYNNFKRTIIIPQGKFREFLELKPADRTRMLNEIFNLERFDLAPKVAAIKSQNELALSTLLGRMEQYQDLSRDLLKNKNDAQSYLLAQEKEEQNELNKLYKDFELLNQKKRLFENLSKAESVFKQLEQSKGVFKQRKKQLEQYTDCRVNFSQLMASQNSLTQEVNQKLLQRQQLVKFFDERSHQKIKLDKQLIDVKVTYNQKENLILQAEELDSIIATRLLLKNKQAVDVRIKKGALIISEQKIENEKKQHALQQSQAELLRLKKQLPNISELNEVKFFYIKQADLSQNIENMLAVTKAVSDEIKLLTDNFEIQFKEQFPDIAVNIKELKLDKVKEKITSQTKKLKNCLTELNDKLNHTLAQEKLKQWAAGLEDDESCPLCGSKEHPKVLNIVALENEVLAIKLQQDSIEKDIVSYNEFLLKIKNLEYQVKLLDQSLEAKAKEKKHKEDEILAHENSFCWDKLWGSTDLESIEKLISDAKIMLKKIEKIEKLMANMTTELIDCQKNIDKYSKVHQQLRDKDTVLDTTIQNDIRKLKLLSFEQLEHQSNEELVSQSQKQQQKVQKSITDFDRLSTELSKIQSEIDKTQGQEKILTELLKEKQILLSEVQKILADKLSDSNYVGLDEISTVLSKKLNELEENQIISDFEAELKMAYQTQESLQKDTRGKEFNQEMLGIIQNQISSKEGFIKGISSKIAIIQTEIKKLNVDLDNKNKLENDYQQLTKRKDNIDILAKLFKGQGFVRYISSVYLQNLSEAANTRFFKMTRQQLQLEIAENPSSTTLDFQVRDFLNEGKTRSVKTLSGGQMFQASLSLALALADSVQNQIKAQHKFFFLDEGFGSLDNESLHIVFEALKSLKHENRIVGVISHVESLKQEIDVHLQVNKSDERGSLINYSWV